MAETAHEGVMLAIIPRELNGGNSTRIRMLDFQNGRPGIVRAAVFHQDDFMAIFRSFEDAKHSLHQGADRSRRSINGNNDRNINGGVGFHISADHSSPKW